MGIDSLDVTVFALVFVATAYKSWLFFVVTLSAYLLIRVGWIGIEAYEVYCTYQIAIGAVALQPVYDWDMRKSMCWSMATGRDYMLIRKEHPRCASALRLHAHEFTLGRRTR